MNAQMGIASKEKKLYVVLNNSLLQCTSYEYHIVMDKNIVSEKILLHIDMSLFSKV